MAEPTPTTNATASLAARTATLRFEQIPSDVVTAAKQRILDVLGVVPARGTESVSVSKTPPSTAGSSYPAAHPRQPRRAPTQNWPICTRPSPTLDRLSAAPNRCSVSLLLF